MIIFMMNLETTLVLKLSLTKRVIVMRRKRKIFQIGFAKIMMRCLMVMGKLMVQMGGT